MTSAASVNQASAARVCSSIISPYAVGYPTTQSTRQHDLVAVVHRLDDRPGHAPVERDARHHHRLRRQALEDPVQLGTGVGRHAVVPVQDDVGIVEQFGDGLDLGRTFDQEGFVGHAALQDRCVAEAADVVGAEGGGHVDDPYAGPPGGGEQSGHGGDDVRLGHGLGRLPTGVGHVADDPPLHLVTEHHRRGRFDQLGKPGHPPPPALVGPLRRAARRPAGRRSR